LLGWSTLGEDRSNFVANHHAFVGHAQPIPHHSSIFSMEFCVDGSL
jgi:hypothetical protein